MATTTMTVASPPEYSKSSLSTGTGTAGRVVLNVCPDGHLLINKVVTGGLFGLNLKRCVRCNEQLKTGFRRHSCKLCGFHLCESCWTLWMGREAPKVLLGSTPTTKSSPMRASSSTSMVTKSATVVPACKYGAACYQKSSWHLQQFAHPGDRHYRHGLVSFSSGQCPEFQSLWQLFQYHDRAESGHLDREEFALALHSCSLFHRDLPPLEEAWETAGGPCTGFVNFSEFAHFAESLSLALPLGLEPKGAPRPCRFRIRLINNGEDGDEEYTCSCSCFDADKRSEGMICRCGHKLSMHRSDYAEDTYSSICAPPLAWLPGCEGLVEVTNQELLGRLQSMLNSSHKSHDNWTRDRGCRLHGVHGCSWACAAKNRCPVPNGFMLQAAYRNQSPELWRRYCLLKQAIRSECARGEEFPQPSLLSASDLDEPLDKDCNEWRCFHGSAPVNLRGICASNFKPAKAGTGATWKDAGASKGTPLYGFGFYFAERITKADEYARPMPDGDHEGLFAVLVCRVVGGRTKVVTNNDIDVDGLRGSVFDGPYHSVFGDRVATLGKPYRPLDELDVGKLDGVESLAWDCWDQ
ncbi:unnamed protein product [Effrenium voratum]|nr:unnamed protein product [Effrenium voratum]